jgi:hypothetical protein
MKTRIATLPFCLIALLLAASPARAAEEPKPVELQTTDPRAAAVVTLFNAGLANDVNAFKASFSKQVSEKLKGKEAEAMADYTRKYKQLFNEAKPQDLVYTFSGDEKEGKVFLATKEEKAKVSPKLRVLKEGDVWKVDEN